MPPQKPVEPADPDHYHELQVEESASTSEIRRSYLTLSLQYHPDKLPPGASDNRFKKICNAYETLTDAATRAMYDTIFPKVRDDWVQYDQQLERWQRYESQRQRQKKERQRQDAESIEQTRLTEERRKQKKAESNRIWRQRRAQEKAAAAERQAQEDRDRKIREERARIEKEGREAWKQANEEKARQEQQEAEQRAQEQAREETERRNREEEKEVQRRAAEQLRAEAFAAKQRLREKREAEAEERERRMAERANAERQRAAEARLRHEREQEANKRMRQAADSARIIEEAQEQLQRQEEQEAEIQWQAAIDRAQAEAVKRFKEEALDLERRNRRITEDQRRIAEEWARANARRQEEDEDFKPVVTSDQDHKREAEAAEHFIQEIMNIRRQSKAEVLKDVVLITIEVIDQELKTQKGHRKRRLASRSDDPARLPAFVTELFAKLETGDESHEKFRFTKKRKLT